MSSTEETRTVADAPVAKYELTVVIRGNTHDEIEDELHYLVNGAYRLDSNHGTRDEFHVIGGKITTTLRHTNPDMTPERYREELDTWFDARKAKR